MLGLMTVRSTLHWRVVAAVLTALLSSLLAATVMAGEDCADFTPYGGSCPPQTGGTCAVGPNPADCAQDCSTCTPGVDDDGDCIEDEEIINNLDDDGDGLIDEDVKCVNACPPGPTCPFDQTATFGTPAPVESTIQLSAKVAGWSCTGNPDDVLDVTLELEPAADTNNNPTCGHHIVTVRVRLTTGEILFEGPGSFLFSRRWESLDGSLISGAVGNVDVFRFVVRADLERVMPYAQLPPAMRVPCSEDANARPHTYFFGYADVARDSAQPTDRNFYRHSLVVGHTPGRFMHPEGQAVPGFPPRILCDPVTNDTTARPITAGASARHDDGGFYIVAPGDTFSFGQALQVPTGSYTFGRIRQVASAGQQCPRATRMCESQFTDTGQGFCASRITYRHSRFCGLENSGGCPVFNIAAHTKCDTIPSDRVAFYPVGQWTQTEYPSTQMAHIFEGGMVCLNNFVPYWYGGYTHTPSTGPFWQAPPDALDVVDNQVIPNSQGFGAALFGGVSWAPNGEFFPLQFRTMSFFSAENPDIPGLAPCQADALLDVPAPAPCANDPLTLTGDRSWVVNCCSCGSIEYQWSHFAGTWIVDQPWSTTANFATTMPAACTDYRLEVRCSNSRSACVDSEIVNVCPGCLCGNGALDPGEGCDDGNQLPGDGCRADCTPEVCGDGILDPQEVCDDGNADPADTCANCQLTTCGDGIIQTPNGQGQNEECDDGNPIPNDGCTGCQTDRCAAPAIQPIALLWAIKSPNDLDVVMSFSPDAFADGYNVWFVDLKENIPQARLGGAGSRPIGCDPTAAASCWHLDAVPVVPEGPRLFYQVRGVCGPSEAAE